MMPTLKSLFAMAVCLFVISHSFAQAVDSATAKKIDGLFKQWDKKNSPGCAIGIVRNDSLIYAKGYGMANLEYQIPITTKTIFEMGSVSKQFTAYAIMLLAQQGKLHLDDDIHKYLPWVPDFEKKITIANLLYHTSGIRDYDQLLQIAGTTAEDVVTREHIIKILSKQQTLNFDPGEQYMYSNSGYFLLGEIVHAVTGKTLRQFTDSAIFKPLGMNSTHFHDDYTEVVSNRAYPYWQAGKISIVNSSAVGAKQLFTNIDDMTKWVIAFADSKSVFYPIMQQLIVPGRFNNGKETGAGMTQVGAGIQINDFEGLKTYGHGGVDGGYHNSVRYIPDANMAFAVFSNDGSMYTGNKVDEIAGLFIKSKMPRKTQAAIKLRGDSIITDTASAKPLLGQYIVEDGERAEFRLKNQKFYYFNYGTDYLLQRTAIDSFYYAGYSTGIKFAFTRKNNGSITVRQTWPEGFGRAMKKVDAKSKLSDNQLLTYTGKYYSKELDFSYSIILKDHQLTLTNAKYKDSPITIYDETRLLNTLDWMRTLIVTRDKKGKITGFEVNHNLIQDLRFEKIE